MGTLYLIATPIGNLEDITLRALRLLGSVQLIAAEDTRHTRKLLDRYEITTPTLAYHEHNKLVRLDTILGALQIGDVALVSDAGTPAINDPGYELVGAAITAGWPVVPVPGPSAPIAALIASGLPTDRWTFLGFLPNRGAARRSMLSECAALPTTLICFEAPHRLQAALSDLLLVLGDRRIAVARELTKLHEEIVRGTITTVQAHFAVHSPRGECTLVIDRAPPQDTPSPEVDDNAWQARAGEQLQILAEQGIGGAAAVKQVAKTLGVDRHEVYALWNELREARD
ncbi:MAG: 16S rRNA (cytidine(1402)-2'-O)-methyltransferase [Herpetosiphonaceae bacterium]|nr:16S rRNA (cytidine(1402)-2'-O)-methyltransferase [Herpetosiphonaceae bacterium]